MKGLILLPVTLATAAHCVRLSISKDDAAKTAAESTLSLKENKPVTAQHARADRIAVLTRTLVILIKSILFCNFEKVKQTSSVELKLVISFLIYIFFSILCYLFYFILSFLFYITLVILLKSILFRNLWKRQTNFICWIKISIFYSILSFLFFITKVGNPVKIHPFS